MHSFKVAVYAVMRRTLSIAALVLICALLLPWPAAAGMQDIPAGHWSYTAIKDLAAAGLYAPYLEDVATSGLRSRYEIALTLRKAAEVIDTITLGAAAPDIPVATRVELRLQGLGRQLDALGRIQSDIQQRYAWADSLGGETYLQQPLNLLSTGLPGLRMEHSVLKKECAKLQAQATASSVAGWQRLDGNLDKLLVKIEALHAVVAEAAPAEYAAVAGGQESQTRQAIRDNIPAEVRRGKTARQLNILAETAWQQMQKAQKEFAVELAALHPTERTTWITGVTLPNANGVWSAVNPGVTSLSDTLRTQPTSSAGGIDVSGETQTRLTGTAISGNLLQARSDGVSDSASFDQMLQLQVNANLPGGNNLQAGVKGSSDLFAPPSTAISIDDISLHMKSDVWETQAGSNMKDQTLTPYTLHSQTLSGARTQFETGRTKGTLLLGKTTGDSAQYLAALNSQYKVNSDFEVGATVVSNLDKNTAASLSSSTNNGRLDASVQAKWQPNKRLTFLSEMAFSDVDKRKITENNKAFRLTGLTELYGVNFMAKWHRVDSEFNPSFVTPASDTYQTDSSGYSLEASSALGPLLVHAGIGESHSLAGDNVTHTRKIGADYGFDFLGASMKTGVELTDETGIMGSTTLSSMLSADLPLSDAASLKAKVEMVDIDYLRGVTSNDAAKARETVAKLGLSGSVALGKMGALRVGYELAQSASAQSNSITTSADAGLEYNLNDKAKLAAGVNYDTGAGGSRSVTDFNLGYDLTKDTNLMAGYKLINFNDVANGDYSANIAQARLSVKF